LPRDRLGHHFGDVGHADHLDLGHWGDRSEK
jgi:hypothetical protein